MITRVCRVGAAVLATLAVAAACYAADAPAGKTAPAPSGNPGPGGIGGMLGASTFALDRAFGNDWFVDYSNGASPRLAFDAHWRYQFAHRWRAQLGTGFAWTGYSQKHDTFGTPTYPAPFQDPNFPADRDKSKYLALMLPVSLQLQYVGRHGAWAYHVGAGPGAYRVWVENRRKVLKEPVSLKLHRGIYPGYSGEIGVEHFFKGIPAVSLEATLTSHLALARRPTQFVSGLDSNVMATELRIGGNYYFTPGPRKATAPAPKSP